MHKLYQRTREVSLVPSTYQTNQARSFLIPYKTRRKKKKEKKNLQKAGRESKEEEKTKDTVQYYILPNYLYALIITRENSTLFSYHNFKFRQKIKCYKQI